MILRSIVWVVIVLVLLLNTDSPFTYKATLKVEGSPAFQQAMEENIRLLGAQETMAWWIAWASEHGVSIQERPDFAPGAWGAWPSTQVIGVWSGVQAGPTEAAILVEEIQHIIDDYDLPQGITCSIEPWSHERVLRIRLMAARLLDAPAPEIDALVIAQLGKAIQADALREMGLYEPCRDWRGFLSD